MADTTVSIESDTLERLSNHRHAEHNSWDETLTGMMEMLPTVGDIEAGCDQCGDSPFEDVAPEDWAGVTHWFKAEYEDETVRGSSYFCSRECAAEQQQEVEKYVPEEPDRVVVGGKSELRTEIKDSRFHLERDRKEVSFPIPGAFAGQSSHDIEYDYMGEPVYIYHEGDYRHHGVIEDIIHEETHTVLILGTDIETTMLNHPDDERREEYEEQHAKWTDGECAQCGAGFRFMVDDPPEACPDCDVEEW